MRIFLAGAAGAIGRRLCPMLVADGHQVTGTTRSAEKAQWLREIGVEAIELDIYDADAVRRAAIAARPNVVMHQLTDLPQTYSAESIAAALPGNARIRDVGTRHLVAAAVAAGATRLIAQSIAFSISPALIAFERQILDAPPPISTAIVLRYGQFYGPGTWVADPPPEPPTVHVDAAADAARRAVTHGSSGVYTVADVDDASVPSARAALGWHRDIRV